MARIKTRGNPVALKARMLRNVTPTVEHGGLVYRESPKKYFGRTFGSRRDKGLVEDVFQDALNDFEPIKSNESEARQVVKLTNHQHLRKNTSKLAQATLAYRKSLREFNVCGNCLKPIRTKKSVIRHGTDVNDLSDTQPVYADIEAHYRVYNHPTKKNKCFYQLRPKTRVFNQKCDCGM